MARGMSRPPPARMPIRGRQPMPPGGPLGRAVAPPVTGMPGYKKGGSVKKKRK